MLTLTLFPVLSFFKASLTQVQVHTIKIREALKKPADLVLVTSSQGVWEGQDENTISGASEIVTVWGGVKVLKFYQSWSYCFPLF